MLLVNPLDAVSPTLPQESSPYFPSSRRFLNPIYLSIEAVPGFAQLENELRPLATEGRSLNAEPLIDRDAVFRLKMAALEKLWRRFAGDDDFERLRETAGRIAAKICGLLDAGRKIWRQLARLGRPLPRPRRAGGARLAGGGAPIAAVFLPGCNG